MPNKERERKMVGWMKVRKTDGWKGKKMDGCMDGWKEGKKMD